MQHCKEAVAHFAYELLLKPRPKHLLEQYQTLLAQFSSEDELEEAIALLGYHEVFLDWLSEKQAFESAAAFFQKDPRLGIEIPIITQRWSSIAPKIREEIVAKWETIRGKIPDRILELDDQIMQMQQELNETEDWESFCTAFAIISELASTISDLNIWYRIQQGVELEE